MNQQLLNIFRRSKLTALELSKLSKVSNSTVGRWIRGECEISVDKWEKIAKALNVRVTIK